ncbi:MAG: ROK family protein [Brachybacterium tyrofermentans]|uniref:ROK family transcriptional regulator n=1 Tax=Brachybacterium tyrofermentans TaxID=47848 RepID=UPI0018686526|nr:ROK family transcriptional regulator [Brachybacterium tyrofermentans]
MDQQWSARDQHRDAVLALLHRGHQLTRGEISHRLRLTRTTVSDLLGDLLESGVITVTESRAAAGRGRPAEVLGIHPGAVRYIGIDFFHTGATICLANSAAEVVATGTVDYEPGAGWERRVATAQRLIGDLTTGEVHLGVLAGIGIGLPGPNSASWDGFAHRERPMEPFHMVRARIRELFADSFDCPVLVDHHIRFAALHEATSSGESDRHIVYLRLSTGVGGAVLGSGSALRGAHLLAGEIGHMIVETGPEAAECRCGRRGCLETVASQGAVRQRWQDIAGPDAGVESAPDATPTPVADPVTLAGLEAALVAEDPRALALVTDLARTVGRALGLAALVTDPDEIVLAGEVAVLLEPVLPVLRETVAQNCLTGADLELRIASATTQQGARGAIAALRSTDQLPDYFAASRTSRSPYLTSGGRHVR